MKHIHIKIFTTMLLVSLTFLACEEFKSLPAAYEQNVDENNFIGTKAAMTLYPTRTTFFGKEAKTGENSQLFIGEYEGITSMLVFRFDPYDLPDADSAKITHAKLYLYPSGVLGDSTASFSATAFAVGNTHPEWDELDMTWSYFAQDYLPEPLSAPVEINAISDDSLVFDLDITKLTKADSTLDSAFVYNGLCIRFDATQDINMIRRFYSYEYGTAALSPRLEIVSTFDGTTDTTIDRWPKDVHITHAEPLAADSSDFLFIGQGYSYESLIDVDFSVFDSTQTINRARLKLVRETEHSIPGIDESPSAYIYPLVTYGENQDDTTLDSLVTGLASTLDEDTLWVEVSALVQEITSANYSAYQGFFLKSLSESADISRYAFYGLEADSLLRPQILIDYSIPPTSLLKAADLSNE